MSDPRPGRHRAGRYRYGTWHGGPDPLAPPYDVRAALDRLGRDVLDGGSLRDALRDLLRTGPRAGRGLDELRAKALRMRRQAQRRGDLDGAVTRARAQLDQALAAERAELAGRDDDDARFAEARLDALPRSTSQAVRELGDYDWASQEGRDLYRQILDGLRRDVLDHQFRGLREALEQGAGGQQQITDMLADLNRLLAARAGGEDTTQAFAEFMSRHGDLFPDEPEDVDELVDSLARRAAAAQRLMQSLSAQQRAELGELMAQALGDPDLQAQMAALNDNLRALRPDLDWSRGQRARGAAGTEPLGYADAAAALEELAELDDLVDALGQEHPGATLDDVDVEAVERQLGRAAADDVRRLRELERELQRQGWLTPSAQGLTLSPKALRRLGQTALQRVFARTVTGGRGDHDDRDAGGGGEPTGASRPWRFGDEQPLDVVRTVSNALRRSGSTGGGVRLSWEDFEVVETERRSSAAVALCVDLSFSMAAEGRWGPMKETALALSHLVGTKFPQDALQIIGFGLHALPMNLPELAAVEPDYVQGTNLQHALSLARRHLRRHADAEPVVLVVTDGEPTAHLEGAQAVFSWPPTPHTIRATLAEVDHLTRFGATINLFMLGEDAGLRRFVDAVARRNGGRVLTPSADRLGQYVVDDYLRARSGRRRAS